MSIPRPLRAAAARRTAIAIRRATTGDETALRRLAALSDRSLSSGPFLLAESDGYPVAALDLDSGAILVDPFRVSYDLVDLLKLRARHLEAA
ncbi:MAG TPA: hypothetical protein VFJ77_07955 [Gaiellaceae bacterium]|nr:hypothetical protein [Gaiellaceae bacterium]